VIPTLAATIVFLVGCYLVCLGGATFVAPAPATRFLLGMAGSAGAHYLELGIRLLAGGAFLRHAPEMRFSDAFTVFGWVLLLTTAGLLMIPWRAHRQFAERMVPQVVPHLQLLGLASAAFGILILLATVQGAR